MYQASRGKRKLQ